FWASWCAPCRSEAGVLAQAAHDYRARGVGLVGVNLWDDPPAAQAFLAEFGITYPNGQDPSGTLGVDYGVTGIPETFVIDGQGILRRRWIGPVTRAALDALLAP
ncbi:MAG: TlpA family protein disulfide reductase, partial [Candidatus Dormibacteraeota bacterium]|nr:TlpA family protein disulfide reductase [Candidatus Dormibacteraeota bacterium]